MKNLQIEKQKGGIVVIKGELPWEDFETYRSQAVAKLTELVSIDGFRKGQVPAELVVKKVGESAILEEMANTALQTIYPKIIIENAIDAIGRPTVEITKLADKNPLGFTITSAFLPEVVLPKYKEIARKHHGTNEEIQVTDEEIEETIKEIQTMRAKQDLFKKMQDGQDGHVHDEHCNHDHDTVPNNKDESVEEVQKRIDEKLELPEVNDDFVKTLGEFQTVAEFKDKLKENLSAEKTRREKDKQRLALIDALLAETPMDLPDVMIDAELENMMQRIQHDVESMGMKFEDYLARVSKTKDDLKQEMRIEAKKRAEIQMLVSLIARNEKLVPSKEAVEAEVSRLKEHHPDIHEESARDYVIHILTNDLVFKMLDEQQ